MGRQPPDFTRLLADGRVQDDGDGPAGRVVTVRVVPADPLRLPSGRLVAAEPPGNFPDGAHRYAFAQAVPPGEYPVEIVLAEFTDPDGSAFHQVAAARVVVSPQPPRTWRLALCAGQDEANLADGEYYGYPVDGGTGSFGSAEVFDALADEDAREDLLADASFASDEPFVTYSDEATGTNLVLFRSGCGDGVYATWIGYTAAGDPACFLTDFEVLTG